MANAQICGAAEVDYVIRDGKGRIIDPSTLKSSNFLNEKGKYYKRQVEKISFSGSEVKALSYRGGGDCKLELNELTLSMGGKTMHLIFSLSLNSYDDSEHSHRVIDSLPFTQGTFRLTAPASENNISAGKWKRVSGKP